MAYEKLSDKIIREITEELPKQYNAKFYTIGTCFTQYLILEESCDFIIIDVFTHRCEYIPPTIMVTLKTDNGVRLEVEYHIDYKGTIEGVKINRAIALGKDDNYIEEFKAYLINPSIKVAMLYIIETIEKRSRYEMRLD